MKLQVNNLYKRYNRRYILKDISFTAARGQSIALTGPNGSGKTTLIKVLSQIVRPDKGEVHFSIGDTVIPREELNRHIGLVGPYLQLYQELTAYENLIFIAGLRRVDNAGDRIKKLAAEVGLEKHMHRAVHTYSSGMKQRLKYMFALMGDPDYLFVDEPTSNLDKAGIAWVYRLLARWKKEKVLVFATNDEPDLEFADKVVSVVS
ncbi:MAG TPA: ABC transporter ATP-binding protein [Caldithrix abyssi]|uniref:ABC transporter ATP-binding protein n=1 Tax=Caldithrix abyssi TaxID=187145 RepID=A0A7V5RP59_CALAY|nr:ABC transporter ATP-binding protein [Caldithrix abyssi]